MGLMEGGNTSAGAHTSNDAVEVRRCCSHDYRVLFL
jgi:hypothetical protein